MHVFSKSPAEISMPSIDAVLELRYCTNLPCLVNLALNIVNYFKYLILAICVMLHCLKRVLNTWQIVFSKLHFWAFMPFIS